VTQTPKPTLTKGRSCEGKQRHDTKQQAEEHRLSLIRAGAFHKAINAWRCAFCDGWHVGHKAGSRRRR
jgi:hypothetical protein